MNELQEIENYLQKIQGPEERLVMEARLILNADLRRDVFWQQKTYGLVKAYGRKQLKAEIEVVHQKLFSEKKYRSFKHKILSIFNSNL